MNEDDNKTHSIHSLDGQAEAPLEGASGLQQALDAKSDECNALNDKYLRLAAEFDNYKRLAQRDQREQIKFGNEQILKELLPVVDNLERAIKSDTVPENHVVEEYQKGYLLQDRILRAAMVTVSTGAPN